MIDSSAYRKGCYLTQALPGTGGRLRVEPEDFLVDEIPLAPPEGVGEHLYVRVEKRRLSTLDAVRSIARILEVKESAVGYAGMKDARAVTRQWLSVQAQGAAVERKLGRLNKGGEKALRVLEVRRGRAKLRRGALAGNRFDIRVRDVLPAAAGRARAVLEVLAARGVPNAFGDQRFGALGTSAMVGGALALGEWGLAVDYLLGASGAASEGGDPGDLITEAVWRFRAGDLEGALAVYPGGWRAERRVLAALIGGAAAKKAVRALPRRERMLFASAFQAAIFNCCLTRRLADGTHDRILAGDVVVSHRSGSVRRVGGPEKDADALARFEVSPAGPLIGEKTMEARGVPGEMEAAVHASFGLEPGAADRGLGRMGARGGRRPYRANVGAPEAIEEGADLRIRFDLPPGAYGTEVLRETMKVEPPVEARYDFEKSNRGGSPRQESGGDR
ncbi:MAG: tRNA pseudouridine(13) synthase TruD [Nitrospinota bacterium]